MTLDNKRILVYSKHDCTWCDKAKRVLENLRYPYQEMIYNVDFTKEELQNLVGEGIKPTVPQIFADGIRIGGYDDLKEFLKLKD